MDPDDEGLIIAVNHFIPPYPPEWSTWIRPPRTAEDDPRYGNMLALAESTAFRGHFTQ
ncbi:hypothetical protein [Methanocalculus taiwanensis]|uniref:hypothetical protein n=1 Tax=Methanocalculus taiwanensis TaxID=106207 RepID=UPI002101CE89|nr:hypothetical protein [Methanocalculus taiwanensis]